MNKTKRFEINPFVVNEKLPLHKLGAFWFPIVLFLTPAIALAFPYFCLCWPDTSDYETLLKQLAFPTFVASLCLPFTVAVGRFHGSKQRAKANNLTEANNTFNHYYSHRQHFVDYLKTKENILFKDIIKLKDAYLLYSFIFEENDETNVTFDYNFNSLKDRLKSHYLGQLSVKSYSLGHLSVKDLKFRTRFNELPEVKNIFDGLIAPLGLRLDWESWHIVVNERLDRARFETILVDRIVDLFVDIASFSSLTDADWEDPFKVRLDTKKELRIIIMSTKVYEAYTDKYSELAAKASSSKQSK